MNFIPITLVVIALTLSACTPVQEVLQDGINTSLLPNVTILPSTEKLQDFGARLGLKKDLDKYAAIIEVVEGDTVELDTHAIDPDGDEVTLKFSAPLDKNGRWETIIGDDGEYEVRVVATDGEAETTALLLIIVGRTNRAPEIIGPDTLSVREGEIIDLGIYTITDPENNEIITSYAGWMRGSTYTTLYTDAGTHNVRIIAEDDAGNSVLKNITVHVENVNRPPAFTKLT